MSNPSLPLRATLAMLAAAVGTAAFASSDHRRSHDGAAMHVVPNAAAPGEPGHGWQYFSDSEHSRAVVISPAGEYYFSRGKGLRRVAGTGGDSR